MVDGPRFPEAAGFLQLCVAQVDPFEWRMRAEAYRRWPSSPVLGLSPAPVCRCALKHGVALQYVHE